jgi:hypothetical protein
VVSMEKPRNRVPLHVVKIQKSRVYSGETSGTSLSLGTYLITTGYSGTDAGTEKPLDSN